MRPGCSIKGLGFCSAPHQTGWSRPPPGWSGAASSDRSQHVLRCRRETSGVAPKTQRLRLAVDEMSAGRLVTSAACRWDRRDGPTDAATSAVKGCSHFLSDRVLTRSQDAGRRRDRTRHCGGCAVRSQKLRHLLGNRCKELSVFSRKRLKTGNVFELRFKTKTKTKTVSQKQKRKTSESSKKKFRFNPSSQDRRTDVDRRNPDQRRWPSKRTEQK